PMAGELAQGSLVTLELEDLSGGLTRWRGSKLRGALDGTAAYEEMRKARIFRKLSARVTGLEHVLDFTLTLDRLIVMAGRRAALGLYDVSDTRFVIVAETSTAEAERSPLWGARGRMERREHAGVPYFLIPDTPRRRGAALALVGDRLVFGNDLDAFRQTLLLAARAAGRATRQAPGPAVAADPRYRRLREASPRDLFARVFVDQSKLSGTRQFDDRWIFDPKVAATVDAALLGLRFDAGAVVETRAYTYGTPAGRPAITTPPPAAGFGHGDADALARALGFAPSVAVGPTDAAAAGRDLADLLGATAEADAKRLTGLLAPARPVRSVEVADPAARVGVRAYDRAAVALVLESPAALGGGLGPLEAAVLELATRGLAVGGTAGATWVDEGGLRVLRVPLVEERRLTLDLQPGGVLVVATDPDLARRVRAALGPLAPWLRPGAPLALRLDVARAGAYYASVTRLLASRGNWARRDAAFFAEGVAGLRDLWPDGQDLVIAGYGAGDLYLEEVHYRDRPATPPLTRPGNP
ncbi:MAG TPA: hypothetical protein VGQ83_05595, partial [Polyangia bacterium]